MTKKKKKKTNDRIRLSQVRFFQAVPVNGRVESGIYSAESDDVRGRKGFQVFFDPDMQVVSVEKENTCIYIPLANIQFMKTFVEDSVQRAFVEDPVQRVVDKSPEMDKKENMAKKESIERQTPETGSFREVPGEPVMSRPPEPE